MRPMTSNIKYQDKFEFGIYYIILYSISFMHFLSTDSLANSADRYVKFCSVLGIPHFQVLDYDLVPIISPTNWISYNSNSSQDNAGIVNDTWRF